MADNINKEYMLDAGTMLNHGRYRILQHLASGGFGNTYVAIDTTFNDKVAIKELFVKKMCGRADNSANISISLRENQRTFAAYMEKFKKEAKRQYKLNNPHIVKVSDLFDENGTSYYVMNLVDGESLSARLKRTKTPLSEPELMHLLPQLLDALECIHHEGIWHLDLKPGNIMIDKQGSAKLIDFGASKQLWNANGEKLSTSDDVAYTKGFASAEQMDHDLESFGPWTDLYSLGATIYNLLANQEPPSQSTINELGKTAFCIPNGTSEKTKKLIYWLMQPKRKNRPQSVADVRKFLAEVTESGGDEGPDTGDITDGDSDGPTLLDPPPPPENDTKPNPNPKWILPIVLAAVVCIGIVVLVGTRTIWHRTSDAVVKIIDVDGHPVSVADGPDNMRQYSYTGKLADTVGALPNGEGVAEFAKYGTVPAATYKGSFVNGICHDTTGNAVMTFATGDQFVGTFKDGYFDNGRYTFPDKSYFQGTFKNGNPYNGKWYTPKGDTVGSVVNGKEQ